MYAIRFTSAGAEKFNDKDILRLCSGLSQDHIDDHPQIVAEAMAAEFHDGRIEIMEEDGTVMAVAYSEVA